MLGIGGPLPVVRRLVVEPLAADSGEQDEYCCSSSFACRPTRGLDLR
jgi:hypothetical protein